MMLILRYTYIVYLIFVASFTLANDDSVKYDIGLHNIFSRTETPLPFWLLFGNNGIIGHHNQQSFAIFSVNVPIQIKSKFGIQSGITFLGNMYGNNSMLPEVFINFELFNFEIKAGKESYSINQYGDGLNQGSWLLSNNFRPPPRLGFGIFKYTVLPFIPFIEIKGAANIGVLNDDRGNRGIINPLLHEKFGYIRSTGLPINPHIGLIHSAIFGGKLPNGNKIPGDFISVFFATPSRKVGELFPGEASNVAGAHSGLFDFGFYLDVKKTRIQFYHQKPFTDGSGFIRFFRFNKDMLTGVHISNIQKTWLTEFLFQYSNTQWQSGPGSPDPVVNGNFVFLDQIEDYDRFMDENFNLPPQKYTRDQVSDYLVENLNYGYRFGGRDNYLNNYMYHKGWTYHGFVMGNPLMLTYDRMRAVDPNLNFPYDRFIVNNRVKSFHTGVKGNISKATSYRFLYTSSGNLGTYFGENQGFSGWESLNVNSEYNYYFKEGKYQNYILLELNVELPKNPSFNFSASTAFDFGDMYKSLGFIFSASYSGGFTINKK
ncbi:MAG: hypothetical protein JJU28_06985 [Cyclobacteriaceae bacterium]|nr:hypothetical protein [Cyclobacteriaceae bacterium]